MGSSGNFYFVEQQFEAIDCIIYRISTRTRHNFWTSINQYPFIYILLKGLIKHESFWLKKAEKVAQQLKSGYLMYK